MTENMQADVALSRKAVFVRCCLKAINEYLMELAKEQIIIAFEQSEKEVSDLHQRAKEGIETARRNGKKIGRSYGTSVTTKKSVKAKQKILKYSKDFGGTLSDVDCMRMIGIARNTYYRYKSQLKNGASSPIFEKRIEYTETAAALQIGMVLQDCCGLSCFWGFKPHFQVRLALCFSKSSL